ncbi:hypothetical protein ABZ532_10460 [Streptomyces sp. NPDC019396]|uniref:hypothetical protein n=1 Tax=Streptomyces sp. NPDC019396 TaxID=3154687 RepID=UPI00340AFE0A
MTGRLPGPALDIDGTGPEITRTDCKRCGTEVFGIDGRYACPVCGWVNHWSEGHRPLPVAHEDSDYPDRDRLYQSQEQPRT